MLKKNRHRWAFLIIVTWLSTLCVSAQISVGAKASVLQNQFTQPGSIIGFSAGAYASYQVLPFAKLKIEPQYAQLGGGRQSYYVDYSSIDANVSAIGFYNPSVLMHTVEVPLLAELTLPEFEDETIVPKLIVGGSYSLMIKATESSTMRYFFNDGTPSVDVGYRHQNVTDNYARSQFGVVVGFGVLFKTDSRDFQFDVRYRQGLTQVNRIKYPDAIQVGSSSSSSPTSPGIPANGVGGNLYTSSLSINFSMTIFNF
ncbi:MAG TPA: outer membrane beta-barrel protein [Cyclobacteriaceae bacterium]|jgi:hypothetical protein|nr:outer membrane beta-barrel protein [Cyclobacteriaceae bacterium]